MPISNLYIRVIDGVPHEHPLLADNLRAVLTVSKLDDAVAKKNGYLPFHPTDVPETHVVLSDDGYMLCDDGVVRQNLQLRELSLEEKRSKFIRPHRDFLLYQSDWTQGADCQLSSEKRAAWATYRQALRDVPQAFPDATYPNEVTWPDKPA